MRATSPVRACSPTEQGITSLASTGGWKRSRPGPAATKLPIKLEGKTGDQIAHSSIVKGSGRRGGSPIVADHGVCIRRSASGAGGRWATWHGIGLTSATPVGDGKRRAVCVQDLGIASIASGRRRGSRTVASAPDVYC